MHKFMRFWSMEYLFDIVNMFPPINNKTGVGRVCNKLMQFSEKLDVPVECIVEALEICSYKNCSIYQGQYWLQTNGTTTGPKNSCSYADIVAKCVDLIVLESKTIFPELRCFGEVQWKGSITFLLSTILLIKIYNLLWISVEIL